MKNLLIALLCILCSLVFGHSYGQKTNVSFYEGNKLIKKLSFSEKERIKTDETVRRYEQQDNLNYFSLEMNINSIYIFIGAPGKNGEYQRLNEFKINKAPDQYTKKMTYTFKVQTEKSLISSFIPNVYDKVNIIKINVE